MEDSGRTEDVEPPRLLAAAADPQRERERERGRPESKDQKADDLIGGDPRHDDDAVRLQTALSSVGSDGSRKFGRSRTDTMVFSEAVNITEDIPRLDVSESSVESLGKPAEQELESIDSPIDIVPSTSSAESDQKQNRNEEIPPWIFPESDPSEEDPGTSEPVADVSPETESNIKSIPLHPEPAAEVETEGLFVEISEPLGAEIQHPEQIDVPLGSSSDEGEDISEPTDIEDREVEENIQQSSHPEASNVVSNPVTPLEDFEVVPESSTEQMDATLDDSDSGPTEENFAS
jgi:hypothetical protein